MTANDISNVNKLLREHSQDHLTAFWGELDEGQKRSLLEQIGGLDFSQIDDWVAN